MKKLSTLVLILIIAVLSTSCSNYGSQKPNLIQSKRRFAEFIEPQEQKNPNAIDLSEGPKLKYDARLGPQNLDFDIKIIDPY